MAKKNESEAVRLAKLEQKHYREKMVWAMATHPVVIAMLGFWMVDRLSGSYVSSGNMWDYVQELRNAGYKVNVPAWSDTSVAVSSADMDAFVAKLHELNPGYSFPAPRKYWDKDAGMLSGGTQIAAQVGLSAYLGAEALKTVTDLVSLVKP